MGHFGWSGLLRILGALVALQGCSRSSAEPEKVGVYYLSSQRLSGEDTVTAPGMTGGPSVSILVTVDEAGNVIDAEVSDNSFEADASAALAEARRWTFRPQTFNGHPVQAVGEIEINLRPPEVPPDLSVPFPIAPLSDVEITLERSACFGRCPDYRVSITGVGKVRFSTREMDFPGTAAEVHRMFNGNNVLWSGTHETTIESRAVATLVQRFRSAHFMGLKSDYTAGVTDSPTYRLTLRIGNTTKQVTDYVGEWVGMPGSVSALEDNVDTVAQTARWVRGNAATVALLKSEGFDFRSKDAAELVQSTMRLSGGEADQSGTSELISAVIAAGLDLSAPVETGPPRERERTSPIGVEIAKYAIEAGNESLFDEMVKRRQVSRMMQNDLDESFASGSGCSARIAKALVEAGANPKAKNSDEGNALHALRGRYGPCSEATSAKRAGMARTLVGLRVPLEDRDELGWTPLMGCDDPEVAQVLLKAGANPNAKDKDGTTVLLSVDDDRVAILLLRAGADPKAKDEDGTVRDQARSHHWPGTLAWLDVHGIH